MESTPANHYERAFENWLKDNRIQYLTIDENKRAAFSHTKIKSFDFLICPPNQKIIIAEVKGRTFKGTTFENLKGFECWVTMDDVEGLSCWQQIYGSDYQAVFVFVYCIENVDIDFDGRQVFESDDYKYMFFALKLDEYQANMKLRSPKWRTVTLPAEKFRKYAIQMQELLV
ncbi:MAG: HYExAFE family protein [Planctomycetota bacterium]|jgi:hypothetical protein